MIRIGRWQVSAEGALLIALALYISFGISRCSGRRDGIADERVAVAQANAAKVARAYKASRDSIPVLQARTERADAGRLRAEAGQRRAEARLRDALDAADSIVLDTAVSRDTLQAVLARVSREARALLAQNAAYRDSVRGLVDAFAAERAGYMSALTLADSTIAAQDSTIRLLTARLHGSTFGRVLRGTCIIGTAGGGGALGSLGGPSAAAIGAGGGALVGMFTCPKP